MATILAPQGVQGSGTGIILAATAMQPLRIWNSLLNSLCAAQEEQMDNAPKAISNTRRGVSYTFAS